MLADIRYALRGFLRAPLFALVAVLSLAIGIGANSAIFSVVNALLLRPLPYPARPTAWRFFGSALPALTSRRIGLPPASTSTSRPATTPSKRCPSPTAAQLPWPASTSRKRSTSFKPRPSLFHLLGARPLYGRLLLPEEDKPGQPPVVILSHAFWKRLFNSDPKIVGKSITLNGVRNGGGTDKNQFTVAGVLGPDFLLNEEIMPTVASIQHMDVFLPLPLAPDAVNRRGDENYNLMARLKPGVTMAQAQADVSVIAARIREKDKRDKTFTISVVPLLDQVVGDVRRALLVLLGSVALVLLIACATVANLLLSRATGRQKEFAVRTAVGASWTRLVRQLLTESVLLSLAGGAAGLLIAKWSLYVIRTVNPGNVPRLDVIAIDLRVLAFTFGISILTGIAFGLAPASRSASIDLNSALKSGGRSTQGDGGFSLSRHRLRGLLVVSELALSLMLLIGAGLLIRSFVRIQQVSPGFNPEHVISMRLGDPSRSFAKHEEVVHYFQQILEAVSVPGVKSQGSVSNLPFSNSVGWGHIDVEDFNPQPGQELQVDLRTASPDYFSVMEVPLLKGRFFTLPDYEASAQQVVVIDEKFAQRFWPHENPIGKHLWFDPKKPYVVSGVVGTVKQYGLDIDGRMVAYFPAAGNYLVARTSSDPSSVANAIVRSIHSVDSSIPVYEIRTMQDRMADSLARQRFSMIMLGAFAVFALVLAAIGVYGVMSYLVTQSRHDIGLRIALGAQRSAILWLVVRQGMELALAGIVLGLIGAIALTRVMSTLLFGISPRDIATFSTVPILLAAIALLATYIPAWRATEVDPMLVLREE